MDMLGNAALLLGLASALGLPYSLYALKKGHTNEHGCWVGLARSASGIGLAFTLACFTVRSPFWVFPVAFAYFSWGMAYHFARNARYNRPPPWYGGAHERIDRP